MGLHLITRLHDGNVCAVLELLGKKDGEEKISVAWEEEEKDEECKDGGKSEGVESDIVW